MRVLYMSVIYIHTKISYTLVVNGVSWEEYIDHLTDEFAADTYIYIHIHVNDVCMYVYIYIYTHM